MRETTNEWLVAEEICDGLEFHLTYVSVEIEHVSVPARVRLNERLIAKYITKILMR